MVAGRTRTEHLALWTALAVLPIVACGPEPGAAAPTGLPPATASDSPASTSTTSAAGSSAPALSGECQPSMAVVNAQVAGAGGVLAAAGEATFTDVYRMIRCGGCTDRFCHGPAGMLSFNANPAEVYDQLVGVDGTGGPTGRGGACDSRVRVRPGDPMASVLYLKLANMPPCGIAMPPPDTQVVAAPFTAAQLAIVQNWISSGAKEN